MNPLIKMESLLKIIFRTMLPLLLAAINTSLLTFVDEKAEIAVIKDKIAEMNNSFPAPTRPAASPDVKGCPRAHQGLYNEVVTCLEQHDDQIKIAYEDIAYGFDPETKKISNTFWIYKKHITLCKELSNEVLKNIPHPKYAEEPTIVLIYPWKEFSVGTRFKHVSECDTQTAYAVTLTDYVTRTIIFDLVPHENAIVEIKQDAQSTRKLFVKIINDLIDKVAQSDPTKVIPYVWGGSSFVRPCTQHAFYKKDGTWHREGDNNPYTGYDCSEFVMRMAKIAGIDFPWKTTSAIERGRRALNDQDKLEEGDLIWVQGHVMIISNIQRNEIIEARSYGSGYGCVHRCTLGECFDGISSYDDLLARYYNNETIRFKDKQGNPSEKTNIVKLLKLVE